VSADCSDPFFELSHTLPRVPLRLGRERQRTHPFAVPAEPCRNGARLAAAQIRGVENIRERSFERLDCVVVLVEYNCHVMSPP
jgi:hypothetical protein